MDCVLRADSRHGGIEVREHLPLGSGEKMTEKSPRPFPCTYPGSHHYPFIIAGRSSCQSGSLLPVGGLGLEPALEPLCRMPTDALIPLSKELLGECCLGI